MSATRFTLFILNYESPKNFQKFHWFKEISIKNDILIPKFYLCNFRFSIGPPFDLIQIITSVDLALLYILHFCRHALINCCHCSESATKRPIELLKIAKSCGLSLGIYLQIMFAYFFTCLLHSTFKNWLKSNLYTFLLSHIIYLQKCVEFFKWQKEIKNCFHKRFTVSWSFLLKMQFFYNIQCWLFRLRQHFGESSKYINFVFCPFCQPFSIRICNPSQLF